MVKDLKNKSLVIIIMSIKPCAGRVRVNDERKWFIEKGKPSTLYTCCEECYYKYIKGTPKESNYLECDAVGNCNCDYQLYNSDCNFEDCCVQNDYVRVSILNKEGERCKSKNNVFHIKPNQSYSILVENLKLEKGDDYKIALDLCLINDEKLEISNKENFSKYIIETNVNGPNNENTIDNIKLIICVYTKFKDSVVIKELDCNNGVLIDEFKKPWMHIETTTESKYRASLNLDVYEAKEENNQGFDIIVVHTNEEVEVYNKDDGYSITI